MMESSNLNLDLHHQEDFHGSSSSLALQGWNQDLILNSAEFPHGALPSSRDFMRTNNGMPIVQEPGFQWTPSGHDQGYMMNMNQSSSSSSSSHQTLGFHIPKNNIKEEFSIASTINFHDYCLMPFHGSFSNVFPSENVSGSVLQSFCPNPLGMDLQALDLLASARFGRTMSQTLFDGYGLGQLQEQAQAQVSTSYHKAPHSVSGVTEAKRSNSLDGGTSQPASLTKKPRFESRSSFTPFKVRKEKLGDRIAALQQLVAPFGKTDTASVLMEAIGYIKFLQDQVETLSVPYMRSSNTKTSRTSQGAESSKEKDEAKPDLRSRGLCLVPLSCTSYVTNENGGVWSPPNYQGGT